MSERPRLVIVSLVLACAALTACTATIGDPTERGGAADSPVIDSPAAAPAESDDTLAFAFAERSALRASSRAGADDERAEHGERERDERNAATGTGEIAASGGSERADDTTAAYGAESTAGAAAGADGTSDDTSAGVETTTVIGDSDVAVDDSEVAAAPNEGEVLPADATGELAAPGAVADPGTVGAPGAVAAPSPAPVPEAPAVASAPAASSAADPHPLYPALDLATLPLYGTADFTYEAPALPRTTRSVTVTTRAALESECAAATGAVHIDVAADLLASGTVTLRGSDCDIALGSGVRIAALLLDSTPQRIRVTGGQIGSVSNVGVTVSDVVFDAVTFNTGLVADPGRANMIFTLRNLSRLAVVNSIGRAAPMVNTFNGGAIDGGVFYAQDTNDVLLANNNFACAPTATANGWFARIETGSNWLLVDNMVKVYFHKMIRLSDFHNGAGPQFDYLVARGGAWMHAHYETMFDQMEHGGESDHVFIEDVSFYVDDATGHQVTFGSQFSDQLTRSWHATNLHWFARSERVVGDAVLAQNEARARQGEDLQYRLGTPTYTYQPDGVAFPAFQAIGAFADSDPEQLPAL